VSDVSASIASVVTAVAPAALVAAAKAVFRIHANQLARSCPTT
jgi:hypothetical protein